MNSEISKIYANNREYIKAAKENKQIYMTKPDYQNLNNAFIRYN